MHTLVRTQSHARSQRSVNIHERVNSMPALRALRAIVLQTRGERIWAGKQMVVAVTAVVTAAAAARMPYVLGERSTCM
eukprot:4250939-Pleurochrysis_carterae.AAC.2